MEWNLKHPLQWDWENLALFYEKESEISRSIKQAEWTAEDGIISNESMYSSASGTCSGSVVGNGSSNNSATASVGSSSKAGNKVPETNIKITEGLPENQNSNYEIDLSKNQRAFPAIASCTGAGEPLIGLKLGKRTYFENFASTDIETSSAVCLLPSASVKRPSICHQSIQHSYCQVEGCNVDLNTAKEYHRKHRVCESHSKSPKVIISGHERRFCQQCSRFHDLSEFDQKKRSCRRRLSEHNARRRKPQPDSHSFHPVKLTSTFYGERGQMDFVPNWTPFSNLRSSSCCLRNDSHGFSLSLSKGSWSKPTKVVADG
ncbi:hypothetical protein HPP92_026245 [Vanilla planifolia]|uniref:SBP-type domain-containing protein n=1 Tax=Vanilla planifolia TaxID=51239 RepID=A0A835PFH7_VANPL|nr:hypothetical protein HPP92_026245 [Vanilla planifolia]